jgi:hypothetical protein
MGGRGRRGRSKEGGGGGGVKGVREGMGKRGGEGEVNMKGTRQRGNIKCLYVYFMDMALNPCTVKKDSDIFF